MSVMTGMDIAGVLAVGRDFKRCATRLEALTQDVSRAVARSGWTGRDAEDFRTAWSGRLRGQLTASARAIGQAGDTLVKQAQQQQTTSDDLGGGPLLAMPAGGPTPSPSPGPAPEPPNENTQAGWRAREVDRATNDGKSDWAGLAILSRYLEGGDDWTMENDPDWTPYMQANPKLTTDMNTRNENLAQQAVRSFQAGGESTTTFDERFAQEMENGESINGYQYLHGTNANVGGFHHAGRTEVTPNPDGTYTVTVHSHYQWNDIIDPNPKYQSDRWKSTVAEIITLGKADPYNIHIGWSGTTTYTVDSSGNIVPDSGRGWPAD